MDFLEPVPSQSISEKAHQSRFSDPGLPGYEDNLAHRSPDPPPALEQQIDLAASADERREHRAVKSLEPTFTAPDAVDPPEGYRGADPLDRLPSQVLQVENPSDEVPGGFGNHNL